MKSTYAFFYAVGLSVVACTSNSPNPAPGSGDASTDAVTQPEASAESAAQADSGLESGAPVESGIDSNVAPTDGGVESEAGADAPSGEGGPGYVDLNPANFKKVVDGGPSIDLYTLTNAHGVLVKITNYGSRIEQIVVPDRNGKMGDIVLGYDSIDAVMTGQASAGAFIGRYANRIAGGKFTLNGTQYTLPMNDTPRPNTLHGGTKGSRFRIFDAKPISSSSIEMDYTFQDMEEGFPGVLTLKVVYALDDMNQLAIDYSATAGTTATVGNFTQHPFFNLSGDLGSVALDHVVTINADNVLVIDMNLIPTGVVRPVATTPMDFTTAKPLGQDIGAAYDLLMLAGGYDNTYVVKRAPTDGLVINAKVADPKSGRTLEIWSTEPAVQLFSANGLSGAIPRDQGKGALFIKHGAIAIEPMHYPDSPNQPSFPTTTIAASQTYTGKIVYKFGAQ